LNIHKLFPAFLVFALFFTVYCIDQEGREAQTFSGNTTDNCIGSEGENFLTSYPPITSKKNLNVAVEIPAGTLAKWELNKNSGSICWEKKDGQLRTINYLGYPGNYGFVPGTFLPENKGGDGDPLDVIVLGPAEFRGTIIECELIGVLEMLDDGEQDDKLIAVSINSPFSKIKNLVELNREYPGVTSIISTWFENYKGAGKITILGYDNEIKAKKILKKAIEEFNRENSL